MIDTPQEAAIGDKAARDLLTSEKALQVKHTPAPWLQKHREGSDGNYRTEIFSEVHGGIATCEWTPKNLGNGVTGTYREANARLIAAAPETAAERDKLKESNAELLEALKELMKPFNGEAQSCDAYKNAKAVIAKAEGKA